MRWHFQSFRSRVIGRSWLSRSSDLLMPNFSAKIAALQMYPFAIYCPFECQWGGGVQWHNNLLLFKHTQCTYPKRGGGGGGTHVYWWYGDVPLWRPPFSDPDFRSLDTTHNRNSAQKTPITKHLRSHAYQNSRVVARDCSPRSPLLVLNVQFPRPQFFTLLVSFVVP